MPIYETLPIHDEDVGEDNKFSSIGSCIISSLASTLCTLGRYELSRLICDPFPFDPRGAIHVIGGGGGYIEEEVVNMVSCTFWFRVKLSLLLIILYLGSELGVEQKSESDESGCDILSPSVKSLSFLMMWSCFIAPWYDTPIPLCSDIIEEGSWKMGPPSSIDCLIDSFSSLCPKAMGGRIRPLTAWK